MPIYRYIKNNITILFLIEMLGNLVSFSCNPSIMTNTLRLPIRKQVLQDLTPQKNKIQYTPL